MRTYNLSGASQQIPLAQSPFIYYRGFSIRETAAAAAVVKIWDSTSTLGATGVLLDDIALSASQSVRECYGIAKIVKIGLYVQVVSGAIEGSINFD